MAESERARTTASAGSRKQMRIPDLISATPVHIAHKHPERTAGQQLRDTRQHRKTESERGYRPGDFRRNWADGDRSCISAERDTGRPVSKLSKLERGESSRHPLRCGSTQQASRKWRGPAMYSTRKSGNKHLVLRRRHTDIYSVRRACFIL